MTELLKILKYKKLSEIELHYKSHSENIYKDYLGNEQRELIINATHCLDIDTDIKSQKNNIYLYIKKSGSVMIRIPVFSASLRFYFPDYKNYYYLIEEECIIHKAVASSIDKSKRKQATKEDCYTPVSGNFIACGQSEEFKSFRESYKSKDLYLRYEDFESINMDCYINSLLTLFK